MPNFLSPEGPKLPFAEQDEIEPLLKPTMPVGTLPAAEPVQSGYFDYDDNQGLHTIRDRG